MSMEMAKKFLEALQKDPAITDSLKEKPETEEALLAAYADLAKKHGFEAAPEELKAACDEISKLVAAKTEASEAAVQEIGADELDSVAGGAFWGFNDGDHSNCKDTYKHKENCWVVDGCDKAIVSYKGYWCAMASRIYCEQISDEAP